MTVCRLSCHRATFILGFTIVSGNSHTHRYIENRQTKILAGKPRSYVGYKILKVFSNVRYLDRSRQSTESVFQLFNDSNWPVLLGHEIDKLTY